MKNIFTFIPIFMIALASCNCTDNAEKAREEITGADLYYSGISEQQGFHAALAAMFDTSGVLLRDGLMPIEGIRNIRAVLNQTTDTAYVLTWKPIHAFVSQSCDLGYTYGTYLAKNKATGAKLGDGTYTTIWKKNRKNEWKALLDTGTDGLGK